MHVDAERTAIDLLHTKVDQFDQRAWQATVDYVTMDCTEGFNGVGGNLVVVKTLVHVDFRSVWFLSVLS